MLHFSRQPSLPDVFTYVAKFVAQRLESQEKKCYDDLNRKKQERSLLLIPELVHECPMKQRAFRFDGGGIPRVAVVNDLLQDGSEDEKQPQLTIRLRLINAIKRVPITNPLVIIRSGAERDHIGGVARFYRIGSCAVSEEEEDRLVSLSDTVFWHCEHDDDLTGLERVTTPTWSLRGLDICNPDEGRALGQKTPHTKKNTNEAPLSTAEFLKEFNAGSLHSYTEGRLLYNFRSWNVKNPEILSGYALTPLKKPLEKEITVAVRYYNHLPFEETRQLQFPEGEEIVFDPIDKYEVFRNMVRKTLGKKKANAPLFGENFETRWKIVIWVMPQVPEGRTLFKFTESDDLADYLHKPYVAKGDTTLFAEVHLCPIIENKIITTKRGRKVQKK